MTSPIVATRNLLIVCKAAFVGDMNAALATIDSGGDPEVLKVPLTTAGDATQAVVARWTSWGMNEGQYTKILQVFGQQGWRPLRGSEGTVLGPTDPVPAFSTDQRFWVWNADTTPPQRPLTSLGLATISADE